MMIVMMMMMMMIREISTQDKLVIERQITLNLRPMRIEQDLVALIAMSNF